MAPHDPVVTRTIDAVNRWRLDGSTATAASKWDHWAQFLSGALVETERGSAALSAGVWTGDAAETWRFHLSTFSGDMAEAARQAMLVADALRRADTALMDARAQLLSSWSWVNQVVPGTPGGTEPPAADVIRFNPVNADQEWMVDAAAARAGDIRAELDRALATETRVIERAKGRLAELAATWRKAAGGTTSAWNPPPELAGTTVLQWGDISSNVVIDTGGGDDRVEVTTLENGNIQVRVGDGEVYEFGPSVNLILRTGSGNDQVRMPSLSATPPGVYKSGKLDEIRRSQVWATITTLGGAGDDTLEGTESSDRIYGMAGNDKIYGRKENDHLSAGAGNDYVDGGSAHDTIVAGDGNDTVYGEDGWDTIDGDAGNDYIDGGRDGDEIFGDTGNDILSGGRDDDTVLGGSDDDTLIAGADKARDQVDGQAGIDTVYAEKDDVVAAGIPLIGDTSIVVTATDAGGFIAVDGSDEFRARVNSDLDTMRSVPSGQALLSGLDETRAASAEPDTGFWLWKKDGYDGYDLRITETGTGPLRPDPGLAWSKEPFTGDPDRASGQISTNPVTNGADDAPPVVGLYRDLSEVYDGWNALDVDGIDDETGESDRDRRIVGLPVDEDRDPSTPKTISPGHPQARTENAFREDLGIDPRTSSTWRPED